MATRARRGGTSWRWAAALAVLAFSPAQHAVARTFVEVRADDEVCFVETLRAGERLRGSFQVVEGGYLDVDLTVMHVQSRKVLSELLRKEEGRFDVVAEADGDHRVCFGNKLATNARKKVQFGLHAGSVDEMVQHEEAELPDKGQVDRLHQMVLRLAQRVTDLKEQEEYLRRRSERHHRTAESNNQRVLLSSVAETLVLLGVNGAMVYYLRQFFEVKRVI